MSVKKNNAVREVLAAKSFGEAVDKLPCGAIEALAAVPTFIFLYVCLVGFARNFLDPEAYVTGSPVPFHYVFRDACLPALIVGVFAVLLSVIKKKRKGGLPAPGRFVKENTYIVFFAVLYLLIFVSTCVNGFTEYPLHGYPYRGENLFTVFCYFLAFFLPVTLIGSEKLRRAVICVFMVFGIIMGIFALVKASKFGLKYGDLMGIFSQFNHYAYFLTMTISASGVLMICEKSVPIKILAGVSFVFGTVVLVVNDTFGGQLSTAAALILVPVMISLNKGKFRPAALIPLAVYLLASVAASFFIGTTENYSQFGGDVTNIATGNATGSEGSNRLNLWTFTIDKIKQKPIFGHGLEGITDVLYKYTTDNNMFPNNRPHNEFLQYAAFYGIPAAIAYTLGCFSVFLRGLRLRKQLDSPQISALAAAFAYLVSSFVGNTMYYTSPMFFIYLGLACAVNNNSNEKPDTAL
ncbi:MAG: O-antigen ligase family protein [Ruminococcus sp.]|nr:O-antigen ligase family protein [Ruminococcus sp.]